MLAIVVPNVSLTKRCIVDVCYSLIDDFIVLNISQKCLWENAYWLFSKCLLRTFGTTASWVTSLHSVHSDDVVTLLATCPEGWLYYSSTDSCFYTSTVQVDQRTARYQCQSMHAELPSVTNHAENDFLVSLSWVCRHWVIDWSIDLCIQLDTE